jgi:poly(3-hydroxybutyrate) depolymerase
MKKLLLVLFPVICYGQGDQTIINVSINATGSTFQAILHLPNDYGTTTTAYPLLIFLHGLGEGGPNPASIYTSSTAGGPAYFLAQGVFPASFVNPKDGKSYKYIVVSPQANPQGVEGSTTAQELDYVLTYLYAHYRVDTSRVYLTGLSDGGESVVEYMGEEMTNGGNFTMFHRTHSIAAIVPMSENASAALFQQEADSIVSENVGAWGFGSTDVQGQNTFQLSQYCNQIKPGSMIFTSYSGGHCCWGQFYDPGFTQNGMSIYQWMLQFTHGASAVSPAVVTTPPAGTIPGKIEASTYKSSIGVKTQNTSDSGGG